MNKQAKNSKSSSDNETNKPDIQPGETENKNSKIENKSGDPGRTPGKAEGSRETVEEDLKQKIKREK